MGARPGAWPWPQQEWPVLVGGRGRGRGRRGRPPMRPNSGRTGAALGRAAGGRGGRRQGQGRDHDGRCGEAAEAPGGGDGSGVAGCTGARPKANGARGHLRRDRDEGEGGGISGGSQQSVGDGSGLGETR
nr:glycine-rich cell wall structural protein-like [Aegilops tauschii subsp. strangulata]